MAATKDKKTRLHGAVLTNGIVFATALFELLGFSLLALRQETPDIRALVFSLVCVSALLVQYALFRFVFRRADMQVMLIVNVLCAIGLVLQYRLDASTAQKQLIWYLIRAFGDVRRDDRAAEDPRTSKIRLALYRLRHCAFVPFDVFRDGKRRLAQLVSDRVVFVPAFGAGQDSACSVFGGGAFQKSKHSKTRPDGALRRRGDDSARDSERPRGDAPLFRHGAHHAVSWNGQSRGHGACLRRRAAPARSPAILCFLSTSVRASPSGATRGRIRWVRDIRSCSP